ncbi:DotD/TraH family lipoprotein [Facilibium subflavum]|uniref:DotD/TraH family lipoprotein n=1 Tax=Facilibium subflavum TaxID=2219058 RepID=UPI0013C2ACEC|nr:DotD/TraH family lipoprotein [Facilibium subflavum]
MPTNKVLSCKVKKGVILSALGITSFMLLGCASTTNKSLDPSIAQQNHLNTQVDQQLVRSASEIKQQMDMMLMIEKSRMGHVDIPFKTVKGQYAQALQQDITLSWYGEVEPLLKEIAKKSGFQLQIYGKKPAVSILVSFGSTDTAKTSKLIDVLRNIDIQMKSQARLYINADEGILSLRYTDK